MRIPRQRTTKQNRRLQRRSRARKMVRVKIRSPSGRDFTITLDSLDVTVLTLKERCAESSGTDRYSQKLIYKGKVLENEKTLRAYGVKEGDVIFLIKTFRTSPMTTTSTSSTPSTSTSSSFPSSLSGSRRSVDEGRRTPSTSPFGTMGSAGSMMDRMRSNPEMMRQMMNSPMMRSLTSDPETIRSLMMNNPEMRRIVEANPELNHVLNDPDMLRQTMRAMQDPSMMEEMIRSQDRAMSNISAHPQGYAALRRMYRDVQEPMMQAARESATSQRTSASEGNGRSQEATTINTEALPNPWGVNSSSSSSDAPSSTSTNVGGTFGYPSSGGIDAGRTLPTFGGMGGFGQGMTNGRMDPRMAMQLMQDPNVQRMWQSMLDDPERLRQMMQSNPMLRRLADTNPMMRTMLENPDMMRQMMSPDRLAAMSRMVGSASNGQVPFGGTRQTPLPTFSADMLRALMGQQSTPAPPTTTDTGLAACLEAVKRMDQTPARDSTTNSNSSSTTTTTTNTTTARANSSRSAPPRSVASSQEYASEIQQLRSMGFDDDRASLSALRSTSGDVDAAIGVLLGSP